MALQKEPEIADLAAFLNACGGCVEGAGTDTIRVQGRRCLAGCTFMPVADRIIASTLACAAATAGGRVELAGCAPGLYAPLLEILEQMGCTVERARDAAAISRFGALRGAGNVHTAPYPGLATDAAPLLAAVMLCAQGESRLQDRVFENRFACAEGFAALGANVRVAERTLYVQPGGTLRGAKLTAPDLRGGAALALAALVVAAVVLFASAYSAGVAQGLVQIGLAEAVPLVAVLVGAIAGAVAAFLKRTACCSASRTTTW